MRGVRTGLALRFQQRHRIFRVTLLAALGVFGLAAPATVQAHAFLIASDPQPGARLRASPSAMTLSFSEPFVGGSARVVMRRAGAGLVSLPAATASGSVLRQSLPARLRGVFVVSWRVLANDGHLTQGRLAFAVGKTGKIPALSSGSRAGASPNHLAISLLVFFVPLLMIAVFLAARGRIARIRADRRRPQAP